MRSKASIESAAQASWASNFLGQLEALTVSKQSLNMDTVVDIGESRLEVKNPSDNPESTPILA